MFLCPFGSGTWKNDQFFCIVEGRHLPTSQGAAGLEGVIHDCCKRKRIKKGAPGSKKGKKSSNYHFIGGYVCFRECKHCPSDLHLSVGFWETREAERERERQKCALKNLIGLHRFAILFLLDTRHGLILHVGVPLCWLFEALIGSKCSSRKSR